MKDDEKTRAQLIGELHESRRRVADLEAVLRRRMDDEEQALRQSEERYRKLFDRIGEGVAVYQAVDGGTGFVFVDYNKAGESIDGLLRGDLVGRGVTEVFPEVREFGLFEVLQRVWRTGEPEHHPVRLYKDDRLVGYRSNQVYKLSSGQVVAIYTDETKRMQFEETQRRSEELLRVILRSIGDAVIAIDGEGCVSYLNPAAEALTGRWQGDAFGHPLDEVFDIRSEETGDRLESPQKRLSKEDVVAGISHRAKLMRPDGGELPIEHSVAPIEDDAGETTGAVLVFWDATRRRQAEREVEQHLRDTAERVKELQALYGVARAVAKSASLEEIFRRAATTIPQAWRHAEIACARVVFDGREYASKRFEPTPWKQAADLVVGAKMRGAIEVYYLEEAPELDDGPFLAEERDLIAGLADLLTTAAARREAEEALQASEEKGRMLAENVTDIIWMMDISLRWVFVSPSVFRLRGYTVEEAMAQPLSEVLTPKSLQEVMALLGQKLQLAGAGGDAAWDPVEFEAEQPCKDGTTIFTRNSAKIIRGPDGGPSLIVGVTHDITEHRLAEEALRESEGRLHAIFGAAPDHLMLLDREHRIQMINRVEQGLERGEVLGTPLYALVAPDDQARVKGHLDRVLGEAKTERYDTEYVRPDGSTIYFSSIAAPILGSGEVVGSVVSSRDVTRRTRLQRERQSLEEQYRQSQKMEAIGRLAGGVAHDFNNLLTVINSYSSMAMDDLVEGDPLRADLKEILEAGKRASTLTRQLLAFSRKQVLKPLVMDLNVVVRETEKMLRRILGEDIELLTLLAEDLGPVVSDPGQIEQVLLNLVVNARDAMPKGGRLTIETANKDLDEEYAGKHPGTFAGPHVQLAVTDNGVGMDAETLGRIFEPFFTTKDKSQGTGLGLATVYGIVKQSGGNIWVYSEPGRGTTFKVYLPLVEAELDEREREVDAANLQGTETILVVEDDRAVRDLSVRILEAAGYEVLVASNAGEALLTCESRGGDLHLVVSDVVMPHMSGRELVDRLAAICPDLKVLYMSGYTDNAIVHHGVLEEGTQFIAKPFTSRDLLKKVRAVLDRD